MRNLVFAVTGRNEAVLRMVIHELVQMFGGTIAIAKLHTSLFEIGEADQEFLIPSTIDELRHFKIENDLLWSEPRKGLVYGLTFDTLNGVMKRAWPILVCSSSCVSALIKLSYDVEVIQLVTDDESRNSPSGWEVTTHPAIEPGFQLYWDTVKQYDFDVRMIALAAHITRAIEHHTKPRR
jgi:hypothetical protein